MCGFVGVPFFSLGATRVADLALPLLSSRFLIERSTLVRSCRVAEHPSTQRCCICVAALYGVSITRD